MIEYSTAVCSYYDDMIKFALAIHQHREDAEDTVQHVIMKFLEKDGRYKIEDLKKILLTAVINRWRDLGRYNKRYVEILEYQSTGMDLMDIEPQYYIDLTQSVRPGKSDQADVYALVMDIEDAINSLQPELSKVIRLRIEGYQYDEIANKLNYPMGTVKAFIFKARSELKKKI